MFCNYIVSSMALRKPHYHSTPPNPKFSHVRCPIECTGRYHRRDSNSRAVRTQNSFNFNFSSGEDDDFERKRKRRQWLSDDQRSVKEQRSGILEEFIDNIWLWKALRSYGLLLPAILTSMVLVTGPKAFLMSLALPMGQSALTLAFKRLWGRTQDNRKRKTKTKMKPRVGPTSNVELEEEEEKSQGSKKSAMGYHSWVATDNVSANKDYQDSSAFKGWDELERKKDFDIGSLRRSAKSGRSGRMRVEKGKFSRGERKTRAPLLLRLLIAVFPFLGSWTKML